MSKKNIFLLTFTGVAALGLLLLGRYQRESFRETLHQLREDFLNYDYGDDNPDE